MSLTSVAFLTDLANRRCHSPSGLPVAASIVIAFEVLLWPGTVVMIIRTKGGYGFRLGATKGFVSVLSRWFLSKHASRRSSAAALPVSGT
jgi:hypothetical protein